mmetsp:Transcript_43425/g.137270  ORF Transcript_43425/g.137270 Transcript_43425/m.137270 type:complete len:89 (-) Transcript_43425:336-602(-)
MNEMIRLLKPIRKDREEVESRGRGEGVIGSRRKRRKGTGGRFLGGPEHDEESMTASWNNMSRFVRPPTSSRFTTCVIHRIYLFWFLHS